MRAVEVEEPNVGEAGRICLTAWNRLDSERQRIPVALAMGASVITTGPIPCSSIESWCARRGLDRSATDIVVSVIARLDIDHAKREMARMQEIARAASKSPRPAGR